jgi:hypothetical protein
MKTHDEVTGGDLITQYPKPRIEKLIRDALKTLDRRREDQSGKPTVDLVGVGVAPAEDDPRRSDR